jgi:hypothetical protein
MGNPERWRDIPNHPGYQASDHGRIRSINRLLLHSNGRTQRRRGKILKPFPNDKGYLRVGLSIRGLIKFRYVHDLVLEAWIGPRPAGRIHGCHADDNKTNNQPGNLSWQTAAANEQAKVRAGRHNNAYVTGTRPSNQPSRREYQREYRRRNGDRIREKERTRDRQRRVPTGRARRSGT